MVLSTVQASKTISDSIILFWDQAVAKKNWTAAYG